MEVQHIALAIGVANFALTWGVALYMYLANKNKVTNERITTLQRDIDDKLDDHATRIAKLEVTASAAPTHDDLGDLHEKVNTVDTKVSQLDGKLDGVNNLLHTIHQYLLDRNGK